MTSIYRKVFSRAFHSHWDRENRWRIGGDMAKWNLWHPLSNATQDYSANLEEIHTQLKWLIVNVQIHYKKFADNWHLPALVINTGNWVYLLAKFIKTTRPSKKLSEKYLGLFKVTNRPGSHSYRVNLLDHLRAIHSVFHISQLEPALPS